MTEVYRIHFGYSGSKRYPQAVELCRFVHQHETRSEGEDIWHIVSFTDSQIDLMAALYKLLVGKSAISPCFMSIPSSAMPFSMFPLRFPSVNLSPRSVVRVPLSNY